MSDTPAIARPAGFGVETTELFSSMFDRAMIAGRISSDTRFITLISGFSATGRRCP